MPILKNAKKALRVSQRREQVNRKVKSQTKTTLDSVKAKVSPETVNAAYSAVDHSVKKNMIHRNKAARLKSQIARMAKAAGVTFTKKDATKNAAAKPVAKKAAQPAAKPAAKKTTKKSATKKA